MIQAINSSANYSKSQQTFGCSGGHCRSHHFGTPTKVDRILESSGREFVSGAIISLVWDGIANGVNLIRKNGGAMRGLKQMAMNAGIFGACWVAANAVLTLVLPDRRR